MTATGKLRKRLPRAWFRYILAFEAGIDDAVVRFADSLDSDCRVLDAGAGEARHKSCFSRQRYYGVDLAVGDLAWDYSHLDVLADLTALPFATGSFGAVLNVVTLEHVKQPASAVREMERVLAPGGRLLLIAPQEWEVHQEPHDYFRYTRYGLRYLLEESGFTDIHVYPMGGFFRVLSRRLLNALQFFGPWQRLMVAPFLVPPALIAPWFDSLDQSRKFTLGYTCTARKP